jgi:hypothetical protein
MESESREESTRMCERGWLGGGGMRNRTRKGSAGGRDGRGRRKKKRERERRGGGFSVRKSILCMHLVRALRKKEC